MMLSLSSDISGRRGTAASHKFENLSSNGCGIAAGKTFIDNGHGGGTVLDGHERTGHSLVRAWLTLSLGDSLVDGFSLLNVMHECPAMDERVCNIRSHFNAASAHVLEH